IHYRLDVEDQLLDLLCDDKDAGKLALYLERHDEGRADRVELAIRGFEVRGDLGVELDLLLDQQAARPAEPLDDGAVDRDHADGRPLAEVRLFAVDGERVPRRVVDHERAVRERDAPYQAVHASLDAPTALAKRHLELAA